jgi:hypothetical protein
MSFGESLRKAAGQEYIEPPNGKYTVKIDQGSAFKSQKGEEFAKVILEITEGDHAGGFMQHFMGFNNEVAKQINAEALASYGVQLTDVEEIRDLDKQLTSLVGTRAEVGVSYRNDYIQIKVHRSWPPEPKSDIPSNGFTAAGSTPAQTSFAAAAGQSDDTPPF